MRHRLEISNIVIIFLCLSHLYAIGKSAVENKQQDSFPPIIVSGNPSILRIEPCIFCRPEYACFAFLVRSRRSGLSEFQISSTGLGRATLMEVANLAHGTCDGDPKGEALLLKFDRLENTGKAVRLRIPLDLVTHAGEKAKGNLIFLSEDYKPMLVSVEIERPSQPMRTAFLWFLGIAIPAVIGSLLTYTGAKLMARYTKRVEETNRFTRHKYDQRLMLEEFFKNLYPELHRSEASQFSDKLRRELQPIGTWTAIPSQELEQIDRSFESRDKRRIKDELASLYPDWRDQILNPQ